MTQATSRPATLALDTRPIFTRGGKPCEAIDQAVARLQPGQDLVLLVPFEPIPLYQKLGRIGLDPASEELPDGTWRVTFTPTAAFQPGAVPGACP